MYIIIILIIVVAIFYWTGMKFQSMNHSFPVGTYYTFDEEGVWLLSIMMQIHVAHFFESIAVPFNAMLKPSFFQGPVYFTFLDSILIDSKCFSCKC